MPHPDLFAEEVAQALWSAGSDGAYPEDLHVAARHPETLEALCRLSALGYAAVSEGRFRLTETGRAYAARHLRPVTEMPVGRRGRVVHVAFEDGDRMVRLSSLGVLPGTTLELVQRRPTFVMRAGETTIALDADIARGIVVRILD